MEIGKICGGKMNICENVERWELTVAFIVGVFVGTVPVLHNPLEYLVVSGVLTGFVVTMFTWFILSTWRKK